jgi:hypothetical protein
MMDRHTAAINTQDAQRHKKERLIRGEMVIELAKALAIATKQDAGFWIKQERESVEARRKENG